MGRGACKYPLRFYLKLLRNFYRNSFSHRFIPLLHLMKFHNLDMGEAVSSLLFSMAKPQAEQQNRFTHHNHHTNSSLLPDLTYYNCSCGCCCSKKLVPKMFGTKEFRSEKFWSKMILEPKLVSILCSILSFNIGFQYCIQFWIQNWGQYRVPYWVRCWV